jgi:putative oxygen-independent coproporphyrinogen III oxidase
MRKAPVATSDPGLYVHYPYCERKCPYCDFNVHVIPHDDRTYADAVIAELRARRGEIEAPFHTLYFGGGTPSEWSPEELGRVVTCVKAEVGLDPSAEITLESNPGTIGESRLGAFMSAGITRFSLGVQSFDDRELESLGRTHSGDEAERIVRAAIATGAKTSLDLIYALPDQTEASAIASVDRAIALRPDHISAYTLTVEPETPLGRRARLGLFRAMDDDLQASMIEAVTARLEAAGYLRYEVSSYAPIGREAVHNAIYWTGGPYLGAGAGAHSYLPAPRLRSAIRRENVRAPSQYVDSALTGRVATTFEERLSKPEAIGDRLMTGLRAAWGIDLRALAEEAELGEELEAALAPALERLIAEKLVERSGPRVRPTARGFLFADRIGRALLEASHLLDRVGGSFGQ